MNKKGFTLIELIATILIICLISLIAVTSINKVIRDSNKRGHNVQVDGILSSAITYVGDNDNIKLEDLNNYVIYLNDLANGGYIDKKITDPINNKEIDLNNSYIKVTKVTNTSSTDNTNKDYKYDGNILYELNLVYK